MNTASATDLTAFALFDCARRPLRVTATGCKKLWLEANQAEALPAWKGCAACRGCTVGAAHAGVAVNLVKNAAEALHSHCTRCRRVATKRVGGTLCVSCYNRAREVQIGRNRKGTVPTEIMKRLQDARIVVQVENSATIVARQFTAGTVELMLEAAKFATAPILFGWAVPA